jgi:hypothetical protein
MTKTTWSIIAIIGIIALLFAGLLPLPGQKDNPTAQTQPGSPSASAPPTPEGPPEKPATGADALKQQP